MSNEYDFLKPLLDLMQENHKSLEKKVDTNTKLTRRALDQATQTNGKVADHEKRLRQVEARKKFKLDPKLAYIIAVAVLATVIFTAKALLGLDLTGLL